MRPALVLLGLVLATPTARAQRCPVPASASPSLAELDDAARLAYLRAEIDRAAGHARRWEWGWGAGFAAATALELGLSPVFDEERRKDLYLGAGRTLVGLGAVVYHSLTDLRHHRPLVDVPGEPLCARLANAERVLLLQAAGETRGRHLVGRLAGVAFSVGVALFGAFGLDHYASSATTGAIGLVVGDCLTQSLPDEATWALAHYRDGDLVPAPRTVEWSLAPSLSTDRGGLLLRISLR